jgi:uncharacterized protein YkwD
MRLVCIFLFIIGLALRAQAQQPVPYAGTYPCLEPEVFAKLPAANTRLALDSVNTPLLHAAIVYEANRLRAEQNLPPLRPSRALEGLAQAHAVELLNNGELVHHSKHPDRASLEARLQATGIANSLYGQNLAVVFAIEYDAGRQLVPLDTAVASAAIPAHAVRYAYAPGGDPIQTHTYLSLARALLALWQPSAPHWGNVVSPAFKFMGAGTALYYDHTLAKPGVPRFKCVVVFSSKDAQ